MSKPMSKQNRAYLIKILGPNKKDLQKLARQLLGDFNSCYLIKPRGRRVILK